MQNPFFNDGSGRNLGDIKLINRAVIFRTIREAGAISRSELAKVSGLNPATVTHIARELTSLGLIEEAGLTESKGGRPSTLLKIRSQAGYIIAVHLDRYFMRAMITDLNLEKRIFSEIYATQTDKTSQINIENLLNIIDELIKKSKVNENELVGIGICAPGPLNVKEGVLLSPPNFPGWPSTPIRKIIEDRFHLPTFLEQDANASATAEKLFGQMREADNFIFLLADGGLGGGLFIGGEIYHGEECTAGEIGHTTVDMNGPQCSCGNYGCLELYASPRSVRRYVLEQIKNGRQAEVLMTVTKGDLEKVSFKTIVEAAEAKDMLCLEGIERMRNALATGITNLVNIFDPEAIVVGGEIEFAKKFLYDHLVNAIKSRTLSGDKKPVQLYFSEMGQDVQIIGAFSLVLRELFQNPSMLRK